jgi:Branched-chain amino acid transport protein (AzlD)
VAGASAVSEVWLTVVVVGVGTIAIKAVGPVLVGGRALPSRLAGVIDLLAPAVLAGLVVTQAVGGDRELVLDERLLGLGAAGVALRLRAPILAVIAVAAVVTAVARAV